MPAKKAKTRVQGSRAAQGGAAPSGPRPAQKAPEAPAEPAQPRRRESAPLRGDKAARVRVAEETLRILQQGYYINAEQEQVDIAEALQASVGGSVCYSPDDLKAAEAAVATALKDRSFDAAHCVTLEGTNAAAVRLARQHPGEHVAYLNFASAKNPGGGFRTGAQAQEEAVARASGLYPTLAQFADSMYKHNREHTPAPLYSDYTIFSPQVVMLRDGRDMLLDSFTTASAISAPACNMSVMKCDGKEVAAAMAQRAEYVLGVAARQQVDHLILGAWGCGVFKNPPDGVASMFAALLGRKYARAFKSVTFAILSRDKTLIAAFEKHFGKAVTP
eukprot:TRINITY_DN21409_c0_g1_i1.p1 TRINITY_DN21409_c0_g1~~TRINITY_DN21409_c0_g1_i1.p1  ORF type:complete len:332 (+),score=109.74 TRINITY_DN21409_c0_g1_i1:40-1035(+)